MSNYFYNTYMDAKRVLEVAQKCCDYVHDAATESPEDDFVIISYIILLLIRRQIQHGSPERAWLMYRVLMKYVAHIPEEIAIAIKEVENKPKTEIQ